MKRRDLALVVTGVALALALVTGRSSSAAKPSAPAAAAPGTTTKAAPSAEPAKGKTNAAEPEPGGREARVYDGKAGRPSSKTRAGSLLKKEEAARPAVDLRGEAERRRDAELIKHFTRIAELDVIEEIAMRENDVALLDRVDTVRRKELRRHFDVLQRLRRVSLLKAWQGKP